MTENLKQVKLIDKETVYNGYFQIVRYRLRHTLFAGGWSGEVVREVFERGHAAAVLPYDPFRDEVVMIEQFRIGVLESGRDPWLLEVIAGILEPGETPVALVHREAREEAGCQVNDLIPMYHYCVSPGGATETTAMFCGRVDASQVKGIHGLAEENEDIKVHVIPFTKAFEMMEQGKVCSGPAIIALQWLALNRQMLREKWGV